MRRIASLSGLGLFVCSLLASQACNRVTLHRSFGQRYRDVNVAQQAARPAQNVALRGPEADLIIQTYTAGFNVVPDSISGAGGQSGANAGKKTAGVPPLH